jgi:hypothetical protein
MLKLREDLLAGREEVNPTLDPAPSASGGAPVKSLKTLQVGAVVEKGEDQEDDVAPTAEALPSTKQLAAPATADASLSTTASLSGFVSSGISWLREHIGSTIDFVCDGGCGPLGVQPRRTQHLIVN